METEKPEPSANPQADLLTELLTALPAARLARHGMGQWASQLAAELPRYYAEVKHGDYPAWQRAFAALPDISPSCVALHTDWIQIGAAADCNSAARRKLEQTLKALKPWRKGPFRLFGVEVDAEWRADYKWRRLADKITPLQDRCVLDVGCGNGYFGWRMLAAGADVVIGLDPALCYVVQYAAIKKYLPHYAFALLPYRLDGCLAPRLQFDSVFSMGVLYHHPAPQAHLQHLFEALRCGGELILETLIVDESYAGPLRPVGRYACMKNISIIPSVRTLLAWLSTCGYQHATLADVSATTTAEQRVTPWSSTRSLQDFLDKNNECLTIEGYPAPQRAVVVAQK